MHGAASRGVSVSPPSSPTLLLTGFGPEKAPLSLPVLFCETAPIVPTLLPYQPPPGCHGPHLSQRLGEAPPSLPSAPPQAVLSPPSLPQASPPLPWLFFWEVESRVRGLEFAPCPISRAVLVLRGWTGVGWGTRGSGLKLPVGGQASQFVVTSRASLSPEQPV